MHQITTTLTKCLAVALFMAAAVSCKKETTSPGDKAPPANTGLTGTDNVDSIPASVNTNTNPFNTGTIPASVSLDQYLPPVGDQGQFGTCVAWATAYGCKTVLEAIKFNYTTAQLASASNQLSPKDLFIAINDADKGATDCNGSNFTPALDVVLNRGIATMAVAPYTGLSNCSKVTNTTWDASAAKHKIARYRRIDPTVNAIKQELANKAPVILGAKLADNFMTWGAADAVYSSSSGYDNVGQHAYHALLIVGYDDAKGTRGAFKVLNSWSPSWGNAGFIWVDQEYMINGFSFGQNFFVAANADQQPDNNPSPNPQPTPAGVDLVPWVVYDASYYDSRYPDNDRIRLMFFDIYNIGNQAATPASGTGHAYIYYNAYDADDFGVLFFDQLSASAPAGGFDCVNSPDPSYPGCKINASIPANYGSLGPKIGFPGDSIAYEYEVPANKTGFYYLVVIADVNEAYTENDENNNLFYTTQQDPIFFYQGVEMRTASPRLLAKNYTFANSLSFEAALRSKQMKRFHSAVTAKHPNAYSPEEILGFLKVQHKNGGLREKLMEFQARKGNKDLGFTVAKASR